MFETDEAIYKRYLANHEEEDFRILVERHRENLILFLMNFIHNQDDAEELMLDTFAEAAASTRFMGKSSFKTWLFSIGKNLALMRLRKTHFTVELTEGIENVPVFESPDFEILKSEQNRQIYEALGRLKSEYRQFLFLQFFEEMSNDEIERVMKKSRKQIYNLSQRSKSALKEELERMGFDELGSDI